MSQNLITELTPEQEALIPVYREKWRAIAFSTAPIDRQKADEAVKATYAAIGLSEPKILFSDSLYAALRTVLVSDRSSPLWSELGSQLKSKLRGKLWSQLGNQLWSQMGSQMGGNFRNQLWKQLGSRLESQLESQVCRQLWSQLQHQLESQLQTERRSELWNHYKICTQLQFWVCNATLLDFGFSVLNCDRDQTKWEVFLSLVKDAAWIYPFEKTCIICERPIKFSFDNEQRLHAEGEPAIQFADGFSVYAHHGLRLPERYGSLPPHQWQSKWLLEEDNAELRRVLIQEIGYGRICQDLQATELDSWQEYTFLKIDNADVEPIYLLKMTCPSTGFIHALRVPPDVKSARQAIRWVNWGIDPEEFQKQT
jgi:hypothetical protein